MQTPGGATMSATDVVDMQTEVAEWIQAKGWNDDRTFGDELILIASELVEALESFRTAGYGEWYSYQPTINGVKMPKMSMEQCLALEVFNDETRATARREGVAPEIAGCFVRLLDTCDRHGFDLGAEFRQEMDYNWGRAWRHGGKAL